MFVSIISLLSENVNRNASQRIRKNAVTQKRDSEVIHIM